MSSIENKDKYVVYHGWVEGEAPFVLFDRDHDEDYERPKLVGGVWVDQEDVPAGAEYQDHFWVELDEDGEITALKYDSELTAEKKNDYQDTADTFDEMQERGRQELSDDDGD